MSLADHLVNHAIAGLPEFGVDAQGRVTGIAGRRNSTYVPFSKPIRTIGVIGDSITNNNSNFGREFARPVTITGVSTDAKPYADLRCANGNGMLSWNAQDQTMTWAAPNDAPGMPIKIPTDGIYWLPSATPGLAFRADITYQLLPKVSFTESLVPKIAYWRRNIGSWMYVADALTRNRFVWLQNFGIGGNGALEVGRRYDQILNSGCDLIIDEYGTNDIVAKGILPEVAVANRAANWDRALARGIPVIAVLISPRWAEGDVNRYSVTLQARLVAANRGYVAEARKRPGVYIVDSYSDAADLASVSGTVKAKWTVDGLHYAGGMSWFVGGKIAGILNKLVPEDVNYFNAGAGAYYSLYNQGGNLLAPAQGGFAGATGTVPAAHVPFVAASTNWVGSTLVLLGAAVVAGGNLYLCTKEGVTGTVAPSHATGEAADGTAILRFITSGVSAGLGTGWACIRASGASARAILYKRPAVDGGAEWQEIYLYGATVDDEAFRLTCATPTVANFVAGDLLNLSFEFEIGTPGCYGVYGDVLFEGGNLPAWDAFQLRSVQQGLSLCCGIVAWEPLSFLAGVTSIQPRLFVQSKAGASVMVRLRNVDLRKAL